MVRNLPKKKGSTKEGKKEKEEATGKKEEQINKEMKKQKEWKKRKEKRKKKAKTGMQVEKGQARTFPNNLLASAMFLVVTTVTAFKFFLEFSGIGSLTPRILHRRSTSK